MPRSLCRRVLVALPVLCGLIALPAAASAAQAKPYIVVFEKSSAAGARAATSDLAGDEHFATTQRYDDSLHGFAAKLDGHDLEAVREDPRVAAVVADQPVRMTADVPLSAGDNSPMGVRRVGAASATTAREASTANVAVIDTGVDLTHGDLNAVAGTSCNGSGAPTDGNGHGTHVAGIIAAKNNGSGAVGVAPGTKVFAVRVLSAGGSGYTSQIICGIDWVTSTRTDGDPSNDIAVANMSLGGGNSPNANCGQTVNDPEHIAICNSIAAGVTYVVAAGNSTADEQTFSPANYGEVLTVTSVSDSDGRGGGVGGVVGCVGNGDDTPASYSNFATRAADIAHTIAAPGSCIRSTWPGSQYATLSGTSMASPHVAGLVALCEGENGAHGPCWGKTPAEVMSIMLAGASSAAAAAPTLVFSGAPSRAIAGRYYGDLASTTFPASVSALPANTAAPTMSGLAATGGTVTGANGTWSGSPSTYATQWMRCTTTATGSCAAIPGATAAGYLVNAADVGKVLRLRVIATNSAGSAIAWTGTTAPIAAPAPPASTVVPSVAGYAIVARTLTGRNGTWSGTAPITYATKWVRCTSPSVLTSCADIAGATAATYTPVSADTGRYLRFIVTASNARATVTARSAATAAVTNPAPAASTGPMANTVLPALAGMPTVTHTLTGATGTWRGSSPSYAYQWQRCTSTAVATCLNIAGATAATYLLTAPDRGKYVRIAVTATNSQGSVTAKSNPMGPVK